MAGLPLTWSATGEDEGLRRSGGGVREEWSEAATDAVVSAWGEKQMLMGRGKLKKHEWEEVAEKVSLRLGGGRSAKTWLQCKNKIDSVKKKYKIVLAQRSIGSLKKGWRLFDRMHELFGRHGGRFEVGGMDSDGGEDDDDDDDLEGGEDVVFRHAGQAQMPGITIATQAGQRRLAAGGNGLLENNIAKAQLKKKKESPHSYHELALAIKEFGVRYERVELARQEKMLELETMRMNFVKELEAQRMQVHMEMAKLHHSRQPMGINDQPIGVSPSMQPRQPEGFTGPLPGS